MHFARVFHNDQLQRADLQAELTGSRGAVLQHAPFVSWIDPRPRHHRCARPGPTRIHGLDLPAHVGGAEHSLLDEQLAYRPFHGTVVGEGIVLVGSGLAVRVLPVVARVSVALMSAAHDGIVSACSQC